MEYKGNLYAKIANKYLEISHTDEFERLDETVKRLQENIIAYQNDRDCAVQAYNDQKAYSDKVEAENTRFKEFIDQLSEMPNDAIFGNVKPFIKSFVA